MPAAPTQEIFNVLSDADLSVSAKPCGALVVSSGSRLTPDLSELIKGNKAALLDYLHAANDPTPAEQLVAELAESPTDPDTWRILAHAYHAHHFNCKFCIAVGRGTGYGLRCGTGAVLHAAYETAYDESRTRP